MNVKNKAYLSIKIAYSNIVNASFLLYIILLNVGNHTKWSDMSMILLILSIIGLLIMKGKIYYDSYYNSYFLFVFYHVMIYAFGIAIFPNSTMGMIKTLVVNMIIMLSIYNYIMIYRDERKLINMVLIGSIVSLIFIILALPKEEILTGRLGHAGGENSSYVLLGESVFLSANSIAFFCCTGFLYSLYEYYKSKKVGNLICTMLFTLGVVLSGSRKGIVLYIIYALYLVCLFNKKKHIKLVVGVSIGILAAYIVLMKIPIIYNLIGERLISMIDTLFYQDKVDASTITRLRRAAQAKEYFKAKPWFGYGLDAFRNMYRGVSDNNYLELAVSGGIVGVIIYYIYIIQLIFRLYKYKIKNLSDYTKLSLLVVVSLLFIEIGQVTYYNRNYLIWITICFAFIRIDRLNKL